MVFVGKRPVYGGVVGKWVGGCGGPGWRMEVSADHGVGSRLWSVVLWRGRDGRRGQARRSEGPGLVLVFEL